MAVPELDVRALEVVDTPLSRLKPWGRNPRRITAARLEQLKAMVAASPEMLQARPLIALLDGTVIAGNQRLAAVQALGWESVPAVFVDLDEAEAVEWAFRDNNPAGETDPDLAAELLAELGARGRPLDMTGFAPVELTSLLRRVAPAVDPDAVPPVPAKPRSKRGAVYELGPHRLMCGDALNVGDHELLGCAPDCILTDPPYGIGLETDYKKLPVGSSVAEMSMAAKQKTYRPVIGDDVPFDASFIVARYPKAREQFWFGGDYYRRTLSGNDLDGSYLVWDKRSDTTDAVLGSGFELIWSRQGHKRDLLRHYWCGAIGSAEARGRMHPTQKPAALLAAILDRWTKPGATVLDPFAGSGSTLIACEQTGRAMAAMEIDPAYCDVIRQRYADYVGDQKWAP